MKKRFFILTIVEWMLLVFLNRDHRQEDLILLPQYVHQFESENEYYELYLRHHGCAAAELVLYAIPAEKRNVNAV